MQLYVKWMYYLVHGNLRELKLTNKANEERKNEVKEHKVFISFKVFLFLILGVVIEPEIPFCTSDKEV